MTVFLSDIDTAKLYVQVLQHHTVQRPLPQCSVSLRADLYVKYSEKSFITRALKQRKVYSWVIPKVAVVDYTQHSKSNLIELYFNRTKSNSVHGLSPIKFGSRIKSKSHKNN